MITLDEIQQKIMLRFKEKTGKTIQEGSAIDMYSIAISESMLDVYTEIENAKNPHIFTNLTGGHLDNTGYWVNLPRAAGESDSSYIYRLMNWMTTNESSNSSAIKNALLNLEYASNVEYVPFAKGSGTACCYVIPITYDDISIAKALSETEAIVKKIASPSLYVEYIVPTIRSVKLFVYISITDGDEIIVKASVAAKIKSYINSLAPGEFLKIGYINKIGIDHQYVDYFNVVSLMIDNSESLTSSVMQEVDTKLLYDEIIWTGV